jgi:WD40 repeat protein
MFSYRVSLILIILLLVLSACSLPVATPHNQESSFEAQTSIAEISTQVQGSLGLLATQTALAAQPTSTPLTPSPFPSPTPTPVTPLLTNTPIPSAEVPPTQLVNEIHFRPGGTSAHFEESIHSSESHVYTFRALEGQTVILTVTSENHDAFLDVKGLQDGVRLIWSTAQVSHWVGTLPNTQTYQITLTTISPDSSYFLEVEIPANIYFENGADLVTVNGYIDVDTRFHPDSMTYVRYLVYAMAGQTISVNLNSPNLDNLSMGIYGQLDGQPYARYEVKNSGGIWKSPTTQGYYLDVYSTTGKSTSFTLEVMIQDATVIEPENVGSLKSLAQLDGYLVFSPDSATFALQKEAGISLLQAQTLEEIAFLPCKRDYFCDFEYSPNGETIAWSPQPGVVKIWDVVKRIERSQPSRFLDNCCDQISYSPDGRLLAFRDGSTVIVWDLINDRMRFSLDIVNDVHFSPDGKAFAFTSWQERICLTIWDIATIQLIRTRCGFETAVPMYRVLFSPDWKSVLWIARAHAQLMDVASGQMGPYLSISDAKFSPDGRILAGSEVGWGDFRCTTRICLFDVASGSLLSKLEHDGFIWEDNMDFSPDGRLLATVDQEKVKLWDVTDGTELVTLDLGSSGQGVAFSPDGRLLAVPIEGGLTQLWGVPSSSAPATLNQ